MSSLYYTQPPTGSPVATDLVGTANYQVMKLDVGAAGLSVPANAAVIGEGEAAASGLVVAAREQLYNPAGTFDRVRSLNVSGHATAIGLPAGASLFFDGSTGLYRAPSGQLLGDAAPNPTAPQSAGLLYGYNGLTWDRLRSDVNRNLQVSLNGGPWSVSGTVTASQGGGWNVGQTAGPWTVSGTVTVGNSPNVGQTAGPWAVSGTVDTELPAAAALADAAANPTSPIVGSAGLVFNPVGTWDRIKSYNVSGHLTATGLPAIAPTFFDKTTGSFRAPSGAALGDAMPIPTAPFVGSVLLALNASNTFDICRHVITDVDGAQLGARSLLVGSLGVLFNGTTVDRARCLNVSGHTTAVGLPATAPVFFDQTTGNYRAPSGIVLADALTPPAVPWVGAAGLGYNGTTWDRLQVDANKFLKVVLPTPPNVGQTAGPWAVSGTVTANQGGAPWSVAGPAASGTAATGNPLRTGAVTSAGTVQDLLVDATRSLWVNVRPTTPAVGDYLPVRLTDGSTFGPVLPVWDNNSQLSVDGPTASGLVATANPLRSGAVNTAGILQDLLVDAFRSLQTSNRYGRKPTYMASSGQIQSSNVAGATTSLAVLWHPSQNAKRCQLVRLHLTTTGASGGMWTLHLNKISANGSGGATGTIVAVDGDDPNSGQLLVMGETGAPTRTTGDMVSWIIGGGALAGGGVTGGSSSIVNVMAPAELVFSAADWFEGKPPALRASASEGWELRSICRAPGNNPPSHTFTLVWTEES